MSKGWTTVTNSPTAQGRFSVFFCFFCFAGPSLGLATNTKKGPQRGKPTTSPKPPNWSQEKPWPRTDAGHWGRDEIGRYHVLYNFPDGGRAASFLRLSQFLPADGVDSGVWL